MTPPFGDTPVTPKTPRLDVRWKSRWENFFESLQAAFAGPRASRKFDPALAFFRLHISRRRPPARGVVGSIIGHILLLLAILPLSRMIPPPTPMELPQIQITWYGPATDVTPTPAPKAKEPKPKPHPASKVKKPVLARAYNPKTTVIFHPPHAVQTRQLLIEPQAPPKLPKLLAALANVISWASPQPVQPAIAVNSAALVARKRSSAAQSIAAPQIADAAPPAKPLSITDNRNAPPAPPISLVAKALRAKFSKSQPKSANAPTVAFTMNRLVALSLVPGTALPPPGNAAAPISVGPRVRKTVSSVAPDLSADAAFGAGKTDGATPGPAGLLIFHESPGPTPPPPPPAPKPAPKIAARPAIPARPIIPMPTDSAGSGIMPHDLAHRVLGMRRIHKLLMDMPNLTSASGSWELDFAEMPGEKMPLNGKIVPPLPVRKVDPEYPPEEIQEGVEGEVVLYAQIGTDGRVSHIRVVQSLDPVLDHNAEVAFAQWKFEPALADNVPIVLEVVVHIPFNYQNQQQQQY